LLVALEMVGSGLAAEAAGARRRHVVTLHPVPAAAQVLLSQRPAHIPCHQSNMPAQQQHSNTAPILRIATHNIRSGTNPHSFKQFVEAWRQHHFHVVAVQELHADLLQVTTLHNVAMQGGYLMYHCIGANYKRAGMAVLVDRAMVHAGRITGLPQDGDVARHDNGRLMKLPLCWGGHRLQMLNCYIPNVATDAKRFILDVLVPQLVETGGMQPVLLGDFNFVADVVLDRVRRQGTIAAAEARPTASDLGCKPLFQQYVLDHMADAFRHLHPQRRSMSWFGAPGAARLDRIYVANTLLAHISAAHIAPTMGAFTDHNPAVVHVTMAPGAAVQGRTPPRTARRLRLRAWFWECAVLRLQYEQWLEAEVASAPAEDAALLQWWPEFKSKWAAMIRSLNRERQQQAYPPEELCTRREAARGALDQALAAFEAGEPNAYQQVLAAKREWAAAVAALQQHARVHGLPVRWLHSNERPSHALTKALTPPQHAMVVPALRHPNGNLLGPGKGQADVLVRHYAEISKHVDPVPQALQSVLHHVTTEGPTGLPQPDAEALGAVDVSVEEVRVALRHSASGKSPGLDGFPIEMYRKGAVVLLPLLARLFSAIGRTGLVPRHFLHGMIVPLYKKGDKYEPENYRPITLLNSDYRLLAKVLANRLLRAAQPLISVEQSAFLRNRHIGDGIMLLQLLPHALKHAQHHGAMVAFLDFSKAYDTISRPFMFAVLETLGLGAGGFLRWVKVLLSDTRACCMLNGFRSSTVLFEAGVRQGCPLSPLLYLCVGEAMLRHLKADPHLGVVCAGDRHVAKQFADDTQVFLASHAAVAPLQHTMYVYGQASGQNLNLPKCSLLPVGPPAHDTPAAGAVLGSIPVKAAVATHGFQFCAGMDPPVPADSWQNMCAAMDNKLVKLSRLPLSPFGRAIGANTYALSLIMYYAEFVNAPAAMLDEVQRRIAHLVDRQLGTGFTHLPNDMLLGPIKQGGMGVLPVRHHITARHALWAVKLLTDDNSKPWVVLGRMLLAAHWGPSAPWHRMLPMHPTGQSAMHAYHGGGVSVLPAPLERILTALHQLPWATQMDGPPGQLPALSAQQCSAMPLAGNPFLIDTAGGTVPEGILKDLAAIGVHTLGRLMLLDSLLRNHPTESAWIWDHGPWRLLKFPQSMRWLNIELARARVDQVLAHVPATWQHLARNGMHRDAWPQVDHATLHLPPPDFAHVAAQLSDCLGWNGVPGARAPVPFRDLLVKHATVLLPRPWVAARHEKWRVFIAEAGLGDGLVAHVTGTQLLMLQNLHAKLWNKLKWHNERKVLFWRLCVNGLPLPSRFTNLDAPCACHAVAHDRPDRMHHFWHCPAAQAVFAWLQQQLGMSAALQRHHVWLMILPPEFATRVGSNAEIKQVWRVVCLAALNAMWQTAGLVRNTRVQDREAWQQQDGGVAGFLGRQAVVRLQALLHDFATLGSPPATWRAMLPPDMPFFRFTSADAGLQVAY
jgi:exonuclease III